MLKSAQSTGLCTRSGNLSTSRDVTRFPAPGKRLPCQYLLAEAVLATIPSKSANYLWWFASIVLCIINSTEQVFLFITTHPVEAAPATSKRKVAINTSQGPATWNQQQGCPQGSCTGSAFWNLVADEMLLQHWPQRVHLQAFADDFDFLAIAGQNRKSKTWPIKHYNPSRPGPKNTNLKFHKTNYLHINKNRSWPIYNQVIECLITLQIIAKM
ncbi:hypothetical protein AVEN_14984-1 [Araneus ventricosus]|uniref:Reverse transcriptase domain-containing protein n=1 Tax=Araneus ventricosus TaxID=182803 RepID=A0A4Y2FA38_ARAVE|nr:hypothetical protein AVEN_14984-1 [Araneus ventricosus]